MGPLQLLVAWPAVTKPLVAQQTELLQLWFAYIYPQEEVPSGIQTVLQPLNEEVGKPFIFLLLKCKFCWQSRVSSPAAHTHTHTGGQMVLKILKVPFLFNFMVEVAYLLTLFCCFSIRHSKNEVVNLLTFYLFHVPREPFLVGSQLFFA